MRFTNTYHIKSFAQYNLGIFALKNKQKFKVWLIEIRYIG